MRMFAAKSEWDLKMSVIAGGAVMLVMSFFNLSMGIMGRALFPDQSTLPNGRQDAIYPVLVAQFKAFGLKGIVVAGILASALSTYDSIGSALSALLTRDVYARLIVRDKKDHHYLRVSQWLTPVIIGISFFYIPGLLRGGMVLYYLELTSAFMIPLLTIFLMGTFYSGSPSQWFDWAAGRSILRSFTTPSPKGGTAFWMGHLATHHDGHLCRLSLQPVGHCWNDGADVPNCWLGSL